MTYRELKVALDELNEEDLDKDVSIYITDTDITYKVAYTDTTIETYLYCTRI